MKVPFLLNVLREIRCHGNCAIGRRYRRVDASVKEYLYLMIEHVGFIGYLQSYKKCNRH